MKRIFALLLALALPGCTAINQMMGIPTNVGNGYSIKHERQIWGGGVKVEYQDNAMLVAEAVKTAANRMVEASTDGLPQGRILIHYEALSIGAANTKWLEYVVLKDGAEVYREAGRDQIANLPRGSGGPARYWWGTDVVDIPVDAPFELVVISNLDDKRDTFRITPPTP